MQPCTQDIKPVLIACFAACEANGNCADAARAHKRTDTCGFRPLVNLPFPLDSLAQIADMQPLRNKGTAEDFFFRVFLNLFAGSDTVLLHMRVNQRKARHDSAAQILGTLYRTAPTNLDVWYNLSSQTLSIITRSRIARHGYAAPAQSSPHV